jgi:hypothetical protein
VKVLSGFGAIELSTAGGIDVIDPEKADPPRNEIPATVTAASVSFTGILRTYSLALSTPRLVIIAWMHVVVPRIINIT